MIDKLHKGMDHVSPAIRHFMDWAAVGAAVGSFLNWMPKVAALFSAIWLALQIYSWIEKRIKMRCKE